jgi:hypothetical protein
MADIHDLTENQPHICIMLDGDAHVIPVSLVRQVRRGQYTGDPVEMMRLLSVFVLDQVDG